MSIVVLFFIIVFFTGVLHDGGLWFIGVLLCENGKARTLTTASFIGCLSTLALHLYLFIYFLISGIYFFEGGRQILRSIECAGLSNAVGI